MNTQSVLYKPITDELNSGRRVVLLTELGSHTQPEKFLFSESMLNGSAAPDDVRRILAEAALQSGRLQLSDEKKENIMFAEPFFPESHLILLGGGHIAKPLAEFGAKCGFSVTVCDDRPAFANTERFPYADEVICEGFDRCFPLLNINKSAFVVIITRGHRHDMDCLRQAIGLESAYIGMIGSRRRVKAVFDQLISEGIPKEKLDSVRSPIGLDINAQTPEEIAISILSEVIKFKRKNKETNWPELDKEVLSELSKAEPDPRALITIVEAKGSVPRGVGAKMIVWPYGKTIGSIGGGCSEGAVIRTAYEVIKNGGTITQDIDLTGDAAAEEGMVCGGTMRVIIERVE